jgi:hypothetical protein
MTLSIIINKTMTPNILTSSKTKTLSKIELVTVMLLCLVLFMPSVVNKVIMLSVVMLNIVMLSVVMLNVVLPSVTVPYSLPSIRYILFKNLVF